MAAKRIAMLLCALLLSASGMAQSRRGAPNIILITVDTLRADRLGCYGSKTVATPAMDSLARDGVVFERALSQVPLTFPSHAAILTGTYPAYNGVQDFTSPPLGSEFRTLAQSLKANGYATGAVVSSFVLDRSWGMARGFDFYDDTFPGQAYLEKDLALVERPAKESVAHALAWLQRTRKRPFFLWLHLYDPHSPYSPPEPFRSQYKAQPYDGEVAYTDHELGRLLDWLKGNGLYAGALVVLVSDHGESLGEHGEREHGFFIYNATTHVPLIVKPPAGSRLQTGRRAEPVETIAVAPTLLEVAGVRDAIQKQFQAEGLFPKQRDAESATAYSETFYPFSSFGWNPLRGLESGRYHYIEAPRAELYDVNADPEEKHNLAGEQPAVAAVLKEKLRELLVRNAAPQKTAASPGLSPETIEKLRALGYVAYRSPVSAEQLAKGLPDPKEKLAEFNDILQATDAMQAGNFNRAEALLKKAQEEDPGMYLIPFLLGQAASRRKDWATAAAQFSRSLELNASFDQAMTGLARALALSGDPAGGEKWLQRALEANPENFRAWYELGWLRSRTGDLPGAQAALEKALAIQPNFGPGLRDLGTLHIRQKNYTLAALRLERAVELGITDPTIYNFLGIAYSQTNRQQQAVESYRKALAGNPNLAEAHLNLAYAYQQLGRLSESRAEYQAACRLETNFCKDVPRSQQ
jgi:arylsulfatase A-like enzyme/Flp pilus assembly protein TadD